MIKLAHFKKCPSVLDAGRVDLSQAYSFCTDTRKYHHPSVFVAIPGVKVNPLDVIDNLLNQKCPIVVYQQDLVNDGKVKALKAKFPDTNFIPVTDSVTFLQELTHEHIVDWKSSNLKNTVFAISGSNGKTTHKEMLSFILNKILPGKIVATEKNNNNHLGVPLTLMNVTKETQFVVLELGSNHPGEIKVLCDIAEPNAGLTTNIGATHLEFFGSEEKVFEEEGYLYHAVKNVTAGKGFYLINIDDSFLKKLPGTSGSITYGESKEARAQVSFCSNGGKINFKGDEILALNDFITGKHNKLNLVTCAFIACHFFPNLKSQIISAAAEFRPTKNRSEWIDFEGKQVYLDAYNANPSSMKAALEGFKESILSQGSKLDETCVVLGDMNELGDSTPGYHQEVGAFVKSLGFPHVYFVGRFASHYLAGNPQGQSRESSAAFKNEYRADCLKKYPFHFIKGSRSLQLESLFDIT
ncbi:MAG: UDP-N-acetylmuramoyl-tripeptide--D-alanyl-D-alanine ligase [Bacteriovoracaceae bacterium]